MTTYRLTNLGGVIREADGAYIPDESLNADWQAYQIWLSTGNIPDVITTVNLLPGQAQIALAESDKTILRCCENSVVVPSTWATYRRALRAIVNGTDTTSIALPSIPTYPTGT